MAAPIDAEDDVYSRWRTLLLTYFSQRIHNRALAEDLTQEVLVRILRSSRLLSEIPDPYIFQVAVNLLRDVGRRNKIREQYRVHALLGNQISWVLDPERVVSARDALVTTLNALPERTRMIVMLHRVEGKDMNAVARLLGISRSSVKKHLLEVRRQGLAREHHYQP